MPFQNVPVRAPLSKSTVVKICWQNCAVFMRTGGVSVILFMFQKMCRNRVNAVQVDIVKTRLSPQWAHSSLVSI